MTASARPARTTRLVDRARPARPSHPAPAARTARTAATGAVLFCVAALAAACGNSTPAAAPAQPVTVTATGQPATSSPAAATTAPVTAAPAGPAPCPTRSLALKLGPGQGAAGSVYQVIDFTNISNVTCTLYGYPGVSLAGGQPVTQVGAAASRSTVAGPTVVTLAPRQTANALLRITQAL